MTKETLKALPLDTLYELLLQGTEELLTAMDELPGRESIAIRVKKKQVEVIVETIVEKKKAR